MPLHLSYLPNALQGRSVTLLELLAAAAGAGIVAADADVRICGECRLRYAPRPPRRAALHRRWRRLAARNQTVRSRFGRDHRGLPARAAGQSPGWTRDAATGRSLRSGLARRRADLDLQLEPALGECRAQVVHESHEHFVGFLLVLDQRVLLAPRAIIDAVAELIEIVEVVLPLLVDHADRDLGQRLVGQVVDPDPAPRIPEIVEFRLERL